MTGPPKKSPGFEAEAYTAIQTVANSNETDSSDPS